MSRGSMGTAFLRVPVPQPPLSFSSSSLDEFKNGAGADDAIFGFSSCEAAVASGDAGLEVVRLLLEAGVDVNGQNKHGLTALHYACYSSNLKVAELLLERGADPYLRCPFGDAWGSAKKAVRKEELLALLARY